MKCTYIEIPGGGRAILCGGRRYAEKKCDCGEVAHKLCDWIIAKPVPPFTRPTTCDHPICDAHAHEVGPNKHLCPAHRAAWALHPKNPKQQQEDPAP